MSEERVYVGNIGTRVRARILLASGEVANLSAVSTKQIKLKKPDGTVLTKTAVFVTDGTDGLIEYLTQSGDLDQAGDWTVQPYIAGLSGWTGHADSYTMRVWPTV